MITIYRSAIRLLSGLLFFLLALTVIVQPAPAQLMISGTVTAKRADFVIVEFSPNKSTVPTPGDDVEFSYTNSGIFIGAGTGKVTEVEGSTAWVKHLPKQTSSCKWMRLFMQLDPQRSN